jgi:hypothetical protein
MELTWLGHSCFRIRGKHATLITDPPSPSTGYSLGRLTADIVTISHEHPGITISGHRRRAASSPVGEYEIQSVLIAGVMTSHDREKGKRWGATRHTSSRWTTCISATWATCDTLDERTLETLGADVLLTRWVDATRSTPSARWRSSRRSATADRADALRDATIQDDW